MKINHLKVVSFEQFNVQSKPPIDFDPLVIRHLDYVLHHIFKKQFSESGTKNQPPMKIPSSFLTNKKELAFERMKL